MFYKNDDGTFLSGKHVAGSGYLLDERDDSNYNCPVDGWYWFESDEEAREFLKPAEEQTATKQRIGCEGCMPDYRKFAPARKGAST